jgi:hypothetical protein
LPRVKKLLASVLGILPLNPVLEAHGHSLIDPLNAGEIVSEVRMLGSLVAIDIASIRTAIENALAKDCDRRIVEESVETKAQVEYLKAHGVERAQEWHDAKPTAFNSIHSAFKLQLAQRISAPDAPHLQEPNKESPC